MKPTNEREAPKQYIFADFDNNSNDVKKEAVKNDVDEKEMQQNKQQFHEKNIAMKFAVQSIPTFIMFKSGQIVDKMMGAVGAPGINMICQKHSQ